MFETIKYLLSLEKLGDGFGMDNVALVNGRGKIPRSCEIGRASCRERV